MKLEPHFCPVCWAMQNPETGHCLVCGDKYNILDVPVTLLPQERPFAHFLMPFKHGFITFYANVELDVRQERDERIIGSETNLVSHNQAQLVFDFGPDDDTGAILNIYSGHTTLAD